MTLLATAASPEARAWAPVPGRFEPIAMVRGRSLLLLVTGPQSILADATPPSCRCASNNQLIG